MRPEGGDKLWWYDQDALVLCADGRMPREEHVHEWVQLAPDYTVSFPPPTPTRA